MYTVLELLTYLQELAEKLKSDKVYGETVRENVQQAALLVQLKGLSCDAVSNNISIHKEEFQL